MSVHKKQSRFKFTIFIAILFLIWYLGRYFKIDIGGIQKSLLGFPLGLSSLLYVAFYVVVTFFILFSKDVFWVVGAVLFGAYLSAGLVWIAEIINACILFYLARKLGRSFVEHHISERFRRLDERLGRLNFTWLFLFRVAPLIPYRYMDLGAGLTSMAFKRYILAALIGSPLKIFWIQYVLTGVGAAALSDPLKMTEYFLSNRTLFALSLIYPVTVLIVAWKIKRESSSLD